MNIAPDQRADSSWQQALEQARAATREQLEAAWQLHVERVEEQLASGWREQIARVFEQRFGELERRLEETEAVREREAARAAAGAFSERFNRAARRLRQASDRDEWAGALLDGAEGLCRGAALLALDDGKLRMERSCGLADAGGLELPLEEAPALASAVQSLDPVVAMHSAGELSEALARVFGETAQGRLHLFPIASRGRAVAVLCADDDSRPVDSNALELLACLGGAFWPEAPATAAPPRGVTPAWTLLSREQQEMHLRAQRFARVQVAEMRLYCSEQVREGRTRGDLYGGLVDEIDRGRRAFREQFLEGCPSMIDYFHQELVRTLANDNPEFLGPNYPGALV